MNIPKYLIIHETESFANDTAHQFDPVNTYHKQLWNFKSSLGYYIGYHILIERDGTMKQARADGDIGAHTLAHNSDSLGICLSGNFGQQMPSDIQIATLKALLIQKMKQYSIPASNIVPHRYFATTSLQSGKFVPNTTKYKTWDNCLPYKDCPGANLADNFGQLLVAPPAQVVSVEDVQKTISILDRIITLLKNYLTQRQALGLTDYERYAD